MRNDKIFNITSLTPYSGQSLIEYVFVIVVVAAALVGLAGQAKRLLCNRWREAADTFGRGRQYESWGPGRTQQLCGGIPCP